MTVTFPAKNGTFDGVAPGPCDPISFTPDSLCAAFINVSATALLFSGSQNTALTPQTLVPFGGTSPYTFSSADLPTGVTIGAATGIISGTPTSGGNTLSSVTITDAAGHVGTGKVAFVILITTFSDTFNRTSGALGTNWSQGSRAVLPINTLIATNEGNIGLSGATGSQQGLGITHVGDSNPNNFWIWSAFHKGTLGAGPFAAQFAQATFLSALAGGNSNTGLTLCARPDTLTYYHFEWNVSLNVVVIIRNNGAGSVALSITATVLAQEDVCRFWIVITSGTQVDLFWSINGGAPATVTDSSASRLTSGYPGFVSRGGNQVSNTFWKNYSCGVGA